MSDTAFGISGKRSQSGVATRAMWLCMSSTGSVDWNGSAPDKSS
ncbi:hypothetical protein WMF18_12075 [Sorangium sp. So ce315]